MSTNNELNTLNQHWQLWLTGPVKRLGIDPILVSILEDAFHAGALACAHIVDKGESGTDMKYRLFRVANEIHIRLSRDEAKGNKQAPH